MVDRTFLPIDFDTVDDFVCRMYRRKREIIKTITRGFWGKSEAMDALPEIIEFNNLRAQTVAIEQFLEEEEKMTQRNIAIFEYLDDAKHITRAATVLDMLMRRFKLTKDEAQEFIWAWKLRD